MASVVSLVLTDIVGSTRRWASDELAMQVDLEQHDALLGEVVAAAGGVVVKHTGDGVLAVFDDPVAAVGAAVSIQQRVGVAVWRHPDGVQVRAGVHTGVVHRRDQDVFGTAVNRAARLMAACPPGGVLVSGACGALLAERGPEGMGLRRVGPVVLAGFELPDEAWVVDAPGVVSTGALVESPVVVSVGSLPVLESELIGRSGELAAVWDALARLPIVTLTGVGGMGKTRLALEVAHGASEHFDGEVWWIDLSVATSSEAVMPVAMAAVGALESPGRGAVEALCDRFAGRSVLVVFDNCEHVLGAARDLVTVLVNSNPQCRVVATSREALGLRREHLVAVGSLPVGDGAALFVERAKAVRPDFDAATQADVIARLCGRLDGIPLAIELAAARCRSMDPSEVLSRLDDRFRLLRGGRTGAERHRTLQATVAWSYELLDDDERAVFDLLGVFGGGSLIDGLVAVGRLDEFDTLDVVDRLVARSMVVATSTPLGTRYHQLETLRQFAEDRLVEAGRIGEVRDRHLGWVQQLAGSLSSARGIEAEAAAFARFAVEVDNLRVAVAHALAQGRADTAQLIVVLAATCAYWTAAWEVFDWVRPIPAEQRWNPISASCEVIGLAADNQRGLRGLRSESIDDVPDWYGMAPTVGRFLFIFNHLLSGGDPSIADELLDRLQPANDGERAQIDGGHLLAGFMRQLSNPAANVDVDELVALAERATSVGRLHATASNLAAIAANAADALGFERPDLAERYASEALAIADRLGAELMGDYAARAGVGALARSALRSEVLAEIHRRAVAALERNRIQAAATVMWNAAADVARIDPQPVMWFWAVFRRDIGVDARRFLDAAGLDMPVDLETVELEVAALSLGDVTRAMLAALERLIDEAG